MDGYDLYGYAFEYDTGEEILEYVDFFMFGKDNMSEVIGVQTGTQYCVGEYRPIINVGADKWEYPYLHNLFEAAREQFEN